MNLLFSSTKHIPLHKEHFKVTATIALSNSFYGGVFASGGKMRILEPEKAKAQFDNILGNFSV